MLSYHFGKTAASARKIVPPRTRRQVDVAPNVARSRAPRKSSMTVRVQTARIPRR
jgi:hypothetical protein